MEEQKHISEEQIKALIQKYEEDVSLSEKIGPKLNNLKGHVNSSKIATLELVISDLKQLITN